MIIIELPFPSLTMAKFTGLRESQTPFRKVLANVSLEFYEISARPRDARKLKKIISFF